MRKSYLASLCAGTGLETPIPSAGAQTQQSEEKPYKIDNGVSDWYTFSGYKRYHSECHVCHGPDGLGSSFAPSLVDSQKP